MNGKQTTALAAVAAVVCTLAAGAAPKKVPAKKLPVPAAASAAAAVPDPVLDPKQVWPAGLKGIAGRYVFAQVASPGGLWETSADDSGKVVRKQVSVNEISASAREKLLKAEMVISLDGGPRRLEASQRVSPSKRGMLRFYSEEALGSIAVRNLPGMQDREDGDDFSGPALIRLDHQSHSNPSVLGVLQLRTQQEPTWGAATLDYADLMASTIPKDPKDEGATVLNNARVLRSGTEIFAYVEWRETTDGRVRDFMGAVRLVRVADAPPPVAGASDGK